MSLLLPDPLTLNPSIDARTAPGLLDLGVALAAGAAGAYVAARRTGTDALPGVAIAVSLVPPLATVGICLELGRLDDAAGAGLLFLTNFASITVVASIVFILTGAKPIAENADKPYRVRNRLIGADDPAGAHRDPAVLAWVRDRPLGGPRRPGRAGRPGVDRRARPRRGHVVDHAAMTSASSCSAATHRETPTALARDLASAFGSPVDLEIDYVPIESSYETGTRDRVPL